MDEIIFTTIAVFTIGSCLHFLHTLPHKSKYHPLDVIAAINESTWEHMKLLIVGIFIFVLVMISFFPARAGLFVFSSAIGSFFSVILLPILYYGYKFLLKRNYLILDILLFLICSFIFATVFFYFSTGYDNVSIYVLGGFIYWVILISLLILWTYNPPKYELFRCPVDDEYGHIK